uniref:Cholesterol 24-hydroxylase n=1 Tax=Salarias fasciatus TaxID=181472 RepID=A0A672IR66_SALFA
MALLNLLLVVLALLFVAFLGYCLYIKRSHMKYDHIPGPPRDSFFLGHSLIFLRIMKKDGNIHDKFLEWAETYGPVFRINLAHIVFMCVHCPETTKVNTSHAIITQEKLFLGNGLVTAVDHNLWYKQRRIMDPAFSSLYLRGLMGTFNEQAEKLMNKLSEMADSKTTATMHSLINCVTLDVITKVAFGVDLNLLNNSSPFPKAIETCLKGMVVASLCFQYNPVNWPFVNEVRKACRLLRTTGAQWINKRRLAMRNGEDPPKDILTQIIKCFDKENTTQEDEEIMLDNFVTFFIAGQETTANQLAFCIMELGRNPDVLEKVKAEVDEVVGMKQDLSYEDLGKLTYLTQVLKETLRMYATAPGTSREVLEDKVINGIKVPGGLTYIFSSYVASRMDKFFKDPLKFDPDRFHPDAPKPYYCYYPFSLGPRSCLGLNFAQMEAKVVMAKLLQRFDFDLVPGQTFDILDTGTLRPKSGVVCTVTHRKYKK